MDLKNSYRLLDKMRRYNAAITKNSGVGTTPRGLLLNYSNACNFKCQQCFTKSPTHPTAGKMSLDTIRRLADEADELGMYEILIEGGEPLVCKDLYEIIRIFGSERFYIEMTSNGYLLDEERAARLKESGMARVSISLDSMDAKEHDAFRGVPNAFSRALQALENVKNAGMQAAVNFLAGNYNIQTGAVDEVCAFCEEKGYHLNIALATPTGNWRGRYDTMATPDDVAYLEKLREKYTHIWRDIWPSIPNKKIKVSGCIAVNRPYINPYGDVLPCSYLHMKLGNIHEKSLKEILDYGFSFPCFSENHHCCYAGEEPEFMKANCNYEGMEILTPKPIEEIFGGER